MINSLHILRTISVTAQSDPTFLRQLSRDQLRDHFLLIKTSHDPVESHKICVTNPTVNCITKAPLPFLQNEFPSTAVRVITGNTVFE